MENEIRNSNYRRISKEARMDKEKRGDNKQKTPRQKAQERKQRRRKIRIKMAAYAAIGFFSGATAGIFGTKLLNPGVEGVNYDKNEQQTVVNIDEIEGELKIEGNKAKQFREELANATISEDARNKAGQQIENIKESSNILDIAKETIERYWEQNYGENVTNVELNKFTENIVLYEDIAKNGDEIIRETTKSENAVREDGYTTLVNNTLVEVKVTTENGDVYLNQVTPQQGENGIEYYTVYNSREEVQEYQDSKIKEVAPIAQSGVEYATAWKQNELGNTSDVRLNDYKIQFKNNLAKHYDKEFQEIRDSYFGAQSVTNENNKDDELTQ